MGNIGTSSNTFSHFECEVTLDVVDKKDTYVFIALAYVIEQNFAKFKLKDGSWQSYNIDKIIMFNMKTIQMTVKI